MIRDFRPEDLDAIVQIGNDAWQPIYDMYAGVYGGELFRIKVGDRLTQKGEQIRHHAAEHPDQIVVCEMDGKVVGFVTWRIHDDGLVGEIGNNAVAQGYTGKRIGKQMYLHVLDVFRKRGCRFAQVGTGLDEAHAPARRAYESVGFDIQTPNVVYYRKL